MAFAPYLAGVLMRSAENILRREASLQGAQREWSALTQKELADRIWANRSPTSKETYIAYYNLAGQAIRTTRDAETMQANPNLTILNLGRDPGLASSSSQYAYRVIVVGRDNDGNEVFSSLVEVNSNNEMSGSDVSQTASAQFQQTQWNAQQYPDRAQKEAQIVTIDTYIVSAGRR